MFKNYCDQTNGRSFFLASVPAPQIWWYLGKPRGRLWQVLVKLLNNFYLANGIERLIEYTSFSFKL